jgi:hypothetical protein
MPLGSLWVGLIAEHASEPAAIITNSAVLLGFFVLIRIFVPRLAEFT